VARVKYSVAKIIHKLRYAEILLGHVQIVKDLCRKWHITDLTYYRRRQEYGGPKLDQTRRLKNLECEKARLKRTVTDLMLDRLLLKEAAARNF